MNHISIPSPPRSHDQPLHAAAARRSPLLPDVISATTAARCTLNLPTKSAPLVRSHRPSRPPPASFQIPEIEKFRILLQYV
ncbi:unnamed protein product [Citrullus colocynthis]|uniref:Uncharacterized protein n=1 Tax=Citrullus colocynthis TaxID=252529 RepID=A0ABP0XYL1_9ROSI